MRIRLRFIVAVTQTTAVALLILSILGLSITANNSPVQAAPLTPEAREYQVDRSPEAVDLDSSVVTEKSQETVEKSQGILQEITENVREKLNLDEPLPKDTKKFIRQLEGTEPIEHESLPSANQS